MSDSGGRWEKAAEAYATGENKAGRELELVVEYAAPTGKERVLDIGTGAGHTALALAPHVADVVLTDPVEAMLATARRLFQSAGLWNAQFVRAGAEQLPFPKASFDIVTTRLAAHHFDDVAVAMREVARVLRPGGIFIFIDTTAPADPESAAYQHEVELLRDPTHKRIYTERDWAAFIEQAGLHVEKSEVVVRPTTSSPGSTAAARTRRRGNESVPASWMHRRPLSATSRS